MNTINSNIESEKKCFVSWIIIGSDFDTIAHFIFILFGDVWHSDWYVCMFHLNVEHSWWMITHRVKCSHHIHSLIWCYLSSKYSKWQTNKPNNNKKTAKNYSRQMPNLLPLNYGATCDFLLFLLEDFGSTLMILILTVIFSPHSPTQHLFYLISEFELKLIW